MQTYPYAVTIHHGGVATVERVIAFSAIDPRVVPFPALMGVCSQLDTLTNPHWRMTSDDPAEARIARLTHDAIAYRAALGDTLPQGHDGQLSNGTKPENRACELAMRQRDEAEADLGKILQILMDSPAALRALKHAPFSGVTVSSALKAAADSWRKRGGA